MEETKTTPALEIAKALVLSTGHLTAHTNDWLDRHGDDKGFEIPGEGANLRYTSHEYGYIIFLDPESEFKKQIAKNLRAKGFAELAAVAKLAWAHGCNMINFDVDGEIVDGLETFEW